MTEQRMGSLPSTQRQLAAVMFVDMVGYSALMQRSESRAQTAVDRLWTIARPLIAAHDGEEIRRFGDGMLLTFPGTASATQCGLEILQQLAAHNDHADRDPCVDARIGIHLGDIARRGDEIFGDGVNIAARLVSLAPPGSVALSPHVRDQIRNTLDVPLKSLGAKRLKNIAEPMEVFCLPGPGCKPEDLDEVVSSAESSTMRWRFGLASYDEQARQLRIGGEPVAMEDRCLDVLQRLLKHSGEIVSRQELCEAAGGIPDAKLGRCIERLRKALRDTEQNQIKTHPGHGYRLIVPVSVESAPATQLTQFDFRPGDHPPLRPLWSLQQQLGSGGQGEVWLARHDKTGEERVYKFALDEARMAALKREITLSRVLHSVPQSQHFIRVLDWNLERPPYFIELQRGGRWDLPGWIEQQGGIDKLSMEVRLDLVAQIAGALAAAHSVGVLHKDLKPTNVLIHQPDGADPVVRLADFGSGGVLDHQLLEDAGITAMGFSRSTLLSDSTPGTPVYAAPELLAGQPATVQADIYALGVTLYQLLVGDLRKPLSTGWEADIDDELLRQDIIDTTQGDPQKRMADAAALARRLRELGRRRRELEHKRLALARAEQMEQEAREAEQRLARMRFVRSWSIGVAVALLFGLAIALYQQQRAKAAEELASAEAQRALASETSATQSAREAQAVADFLSKDLFTVVGEKPLSTLTVSELVTAAADKLDQRQSQLPSVNAQLHAALGDALFAMQELGPAMAQYDMALEGFAAADGLGSATAVAAATRLLNIQMIRPLELPELLPRYEAIRDAGIAALGSNHGQILDLRRQLALAHFNVGQWRQASDGLQGVIADFEASEGTGAGFDLIAARTRLGEIWISLAKFQQATDLLRAVLADTPADTQPLDRVAAWAFLGRALMEQGAYTEAKQAMNKAEELASHWSLPGPNLVSLTLQPTQGLLLLREERYPEGIAALVNAIQQMVDMQLFGPLDFTGEWRLWLAQGYRDAGHLAEADRTARQAISVLEVGRGGHHPLTQEARLVLADVLRLQRKPAAAREALSRVETAVLAALGPTHLYSARFERLEGLLAWEAGDKALAREHLSRALEDFEAIYGDGHRLSRRARAELARAQAD